jgi:TPR repeat protein
MGRGLKVGLPVLALLLGLGGPVAAGSVEDATAYVRRVQLAEAGNSLAQVALGDMYSLGAGVAQDYARVGEVVSDGS